MEQAPDRLLGAVAGVGVDGQPGGGQPGDRDEGPSRGDRTSSHAQA
jgi:hypothetical protein